jgi:hypothetical protein
VRPNNPTAAQIPRARYLRRRRIVIRAGRIHSNSVSTASATAATRAGPVLRFGVVGFCHHGDDDGFAIRRCHHCDVVLNGVRVSRFVSDHPAFGSAGADERIARLICRHPVEKHPAIIVRESVRGEESLQAGGECGRGGGVVRAALFDVVELRLFVGDLGRRVTVLLHGVVESLWSAKLIKHNVHRQVVADPQRALGHIFQWQPVVDVLLRHRCPSGLIDIGLSPGHVLLKLFRRRAIEEFGDGEDLERGSEAEALVCTVVN